MVSQPKEGPGGRFPGGKIGLKVAISQQNLKKKSNGAAKRGGRVVCSYNSACRRACRFAVWLWTYFQKAVSEVCLSVVTQALGCCCEIATFTPIFPPGKRPPGPSFGWETTLFHNHSTTTTRITPEFQQRPLVYPEHVLFEFHCDPVAPSSATDAPASTPESCRS